MSKVLRKIASFTVRWGIAVIGVWWVLSQMSISDQTLILNQRSRPQSMIVLEQTGPNQYLLEDPQTKEKQPRSASELLSKPDRKKVAIMENGRPHELWLLAIDLTSDAELQPEVNRLLVAETQDGPGRWIRPGDAIGGFTLGVPHPKVETGIGRMLREARPWLLVVSVAVFPLTIILTSVRWQRLLAALSIQMSLWRANVLNMVGLFYNTCVPMGSSGGDLLKAYYASKHTPYKTRAVLSVVVDRIIGLIVLIIVGSTIAGTFWILADNRQEPAVRACGYVAMMGTVILACAALGLLLVFHPWVKGMLQSERVLSRVPMRAQIESAFEVAAIYRQRPGLVLWAMAITVPVHLNVVVSALLAGKAFGLPITLDYYYFVIVPVTVLVGAIPISPQGIGVMEGMAYVMMSAMSTRRISGQDVVALTMSIRLVQMFWSMVGGIFVVTGHYHAPKNGDDEEAGEPAATVTGS